RGTNWQANTAYAVGALSLPSACTSNGFVYMAIAVTGNSGSACPASFSPMVCTRQSDGTCSGGTTLDGGVTWQNIGVVSTTPGTAVFDPGRSEEHTSELQSRENLVCR